MAARLSWLLVLVFRFACQSASFPRLSFFHLTRACTNWDLEVVLVKILMSVKRVERMARIEARGARLQAKDTGELSSGSAQPVAMLTKTVDKRDPW